MDNRLLVGPKTTVTLGRQAFGIAFTDHDPAQDGQSVTIQDLLPRSRLRAHPRTMPEQHALTHSPESPDDELKRLA